MGRVTVVIGNVIHYNYSRDFILFHFILFYFTHMYVGTQRYGGVI